MKHIENESYGYQQLIDEISKEQEHIKKRVRYLMTGILAAHEFSDQEFKVFIFRTLNQDKFKDISLTLGITESTARVYFHRATQKLKEKAVYVESKFLK